MKGMIALFGLLGWWFFAVWAADGDGDRGYACPIPPEDSMIEPFGWWYRATHTPTGITTGWYDTEQEAIAALHGLVC